ncbi:metallophosphoesterase [Brotaphodocola sp.]|uniref:metallophosphoesterase n=1 Tax=Brotaphodocola sp. TaxID=3073577 RepID=UPI003D7D5976
MRRILPAGKEKVSETSEKAPEKDPETIEKISDEISDELTEMRQDAKKKKAFLRLLRRRESAKKKRKIRWSDIAVVFGVILLIGAGVATNIIYNKTHYTMEFYQVNSRKLSHSIRIIFMSDIHLREYGEDNQELIQDITELAPDLIILGGDLVIDDVAGYDNMVALCQKLVEIAPTYGVLGNHEDVKIYIQKDKDLLNRFESTGMRFLINESDDLTLYDNTIGVVGLDGDPSSFEKYGAKERMDQFEAEDNSDFKICIAHVPTYFPDILEQYSFELGLAGDAHGGLVRLPKVGALYSPDEGLLPEYAGGDYTLSNKAHLIVSRGLGDSSWWPRINNVPEVSVIDVD